VSERTHQAFLRNLRDSEKHVLHAARWLAKSGATVSYSPSTEAPTHGEWKQHADRGDLTLSLRLEIKRISRNFTSPDDWPFKDFIVCARHAWDRALPKPYGILCLNPKGTHAAFVAASTQHLWRSESRLDRRYGYEQDFYIADKALPVFWSLSLPAPWPLGSA
jgi:hypothetical protein